MTSHAGVLMSRTKPLAAGVLGHDPLAAAWACSLVLEAPVRNARVAARLCRQDAGWLKTHLRS